MCNYVMLIKELWPGNKLVHRPMKFRTEGEPQPVLEKFLKGYEQEHGEVQVRNESTVVNNYYITMQYKDGMTVEVLGLDSVSRLEYAEYFCEEMA